MSRVSHYSNFQERKRFCADIPEYCCSSGSSNSRNCIALPECSNVISGGRNLSRVPIFFQINKLANNLRAWQKKTFRLQRRDANKSVGENSCQDCHKSRQNRQTFHHLILERKIWRLAKWHFLTECIIGQIIFVRTKIAVCSFKSITETWLMTNWSCLQHSPWKESNPKTAICCLTALSRK